MNEIEEFYSYVEMPQAAENLRAWDGSFPGGTRGTWVPQHCIIHIVPRRVDKGVIRRAQSACRHFAGKPRTP